MIQPKSALLLSELQKRVHDELRPGERLIWVGQPLPRLAARSRVGSLLLGLFLSLFSIAWTSLLWHIGGDSVGPKIMSFFGLPFLLVGLVIIRRAVSSPARAARVIYVLTNQRVFLVDDAGFFGPPGVQSFAPDKTASMTREDNSDGSDLIFERYLDQRGSTSFTVSKGFLAVASVRQVEALIAATLSGARHDVQ